MEGKPILEKKIGYRSTQEDVDKAKIVWRDCNFKLGKNVYTKRVCFSCGRGNIKKDESTRIHIKYDEIIYSTLFVKAFIRRLNKLDIFPEISIEEREDRYVISFSNVSSNYATWLACCTAIRYLFEHHSDNALYFVPYWAVKIQKQFKELNLIECLYIATSYNRIHGNTGHELFMAREMDLETDLGKLKENIIKKDYVHSAFRTGNKEYCKIARFGNEEELMEQVKKYLEWKKKQ